MQPAHRSWPDWDGNVTNWDTEHWNKRTDRIRVTVRRKKQRAPGISPILGVPHPAIGGMSRPSRLRYDRAKRLADSHGTLELVTALPDLLLEVGGQRRVRGQPSVDLHERLGVALAPDRRPEPAT